MKSWNEIEQFPLDLWKTITKSYVSKRCCFCISEISNTRMVQQNEHIFTRKKQHFSSVNCDVLDHPSIITQIRFFPNHLDKWLYVTSHDYPNVQDKLRLTDLQLSY